MKKPLIVTPQSLFANSNKRFLEIIPHLKEYNVILLCGIEATAVLANSKENYDKIITSLRNNNISYLEVPAYGFEEFFWLLKYDMFKKRIGYKGELYFSPTNASYYISACAGLLNYEGKLKFFVNYNDITQRVLFRELDYKALMNSKPPKWSLAGVDSMKIEFKNADRSECHYTINGKTYTEPVKSPDECPDNDKGSQAYTYVSKQSGYRLKFWQNPSYYYAFLIDKLNHIINSPAPRNVSTPKAIIYAKNGVAIGVAMENFVNVVEVPFEKYSIKLPNAGDCIYSLMNLLALSEAYSFIHRDVHHNILFGNKQAYIIDMDTTQYGNFPASAMSAENLSGLPGRYYTKGVYFSTVELSFWAAMLSISAFVEPNPQYGRCILDFAEDKNSDCFVLNEERMRELREKAPHVAEAISVQYDAQYLFPCHPLRLAEAIRKDKDHVAFKSVFNNITQFLHGNETYIDDEAYDDDYVDDYGNCYDDYVNVKNAEAKTKTVKYEQTKECKWPAELTSIESAHEEHSDGYKQKAAPLKQSAPQANIKSRVRSKQEQKRRLPRQTKGRNPFLEKLYKWYKAIIVSLFMSSVNTDTAPIDTAFTSKEEKVDYLYQVLIFKKLYKKPLIITAVMLGLILLLLTGATII